MTGMGSENHATAGVAALLDEQKRMRRLRFVVDLTASVLSQDASLTPTSASELINRAQSAAVSLFPGSERQFDLLIRPRLVRILEERFPPDPSSIN
jgi:hypothetical protein